MLIHFITKWFVWSIITDAVKFRKTPVGAEPSVLMIKETSIRPYVSIRWYLDKGIKGSYADYTMIAMNGVIRLRKLSNTTKIGIKFILILIFCFFVQIINLKLNGNDYGANNNVASWFLW